jgi:hypothetical protein
LTTDPSFGALGEQLAPSATALASAVLRLAADSSPESSNSLQEQIKRFEAQAPTDGPTAEAAHAFLAHARLLSNLLPEVERTLRVFVAARDRVQLQKVVLNLILNAVEDACGPLLATRGSLSVYDPCSAGLITGCLLLAYCVEKSRGLEAGIRRVAGKCPL